MGALAPVSPWLPEDDLLLKNSIEAGASLESLAKGAVLFSRKFTVQELQARWHSLLYDPVVSAEASFHMIDFERSAPTLPSKFSRAGNSKENRKFSGKRKVETVRSCYYALHKRIRNEPFNFMDLSFLVAHSDENSFGNEEEPLSGNCMLSHPMPNHYGLQESSLDFMPHAFPELDGGTVGENGCLAHGFHGELVHRVDEDFVMQHDNIHEDIPDMFEENPPFTRHGPGLEDLGQPKQVPGLFGAEHLDANPASAYEQIHNDPGNVCSEFEVNQVFHAPIPECDGSFQNLEYTSPLPEMPIWEAVEEISTPAIPVDDSLREKDMHTGDKFALNDDGGEDTSAPGCDFVHADSNLKIQMTCDDSKSPAASTENYLAELSNSLLNFTNDEEQLLVMDVDGKEMIDKTYYDGLSLLLTSPNEVNEGHLPTTEPETSATLSNSCVILPTESVGKVQMQSSASALDPQFPELIDGIICCTLNAEDPDIPSNDDVFLPIHTHRLSSPIATQCNFKEVGNPISSSVRDFQSSQSSNEGNPVLMLRDQENPVQSHVSSKMMGSQVILEKGQLHSVLDHGVKFKSPHLASRTLAIASGGSKQINSVNICTDALQHARLKEENEEIALVKDLGCSLTDSFPEKPAFGSDGYKSHERNASGIKQELDALEASQDRQVSNAEAGSINIPDSEPVINPLTSEMELSIESDDDVPYFSDIEAMILDMDLDPDDQDLYEQEVSKYQHEDSKKAIMRLEQGANAYMQRAIASHGAFAILYGRYSKHYIKKPEVLLGRGTRDVVVDIDLGRIGRANKISRRQAIIRMDKVGSFHLKNLGKFSISVNSKEVAPGQSLTLNSSCLIEIRGMPFIFETNQTCTKRLLDSISKEKPNS